jgi:hypothetical protein
VYVNGVFYGLQNAWIKHLRHDFAMYVGFSSFEFKILSKSTKNFLVQILYLVTTGLQGFLSN